MRLYQNFQEKAPWIRSPPGERRAVKARGAKADDSLSVFLPNRGSRVLSQSGTIHSRKVVVMMPANVAGDFRQALEAFAAAVEWIDSDATDAMSRLAVTEADAIVVESPVPPALAGAPAGLWMDLLNGINHRMRVIVFGNIPDSVPGKNYRGLEFVPRVDGVEGVILRLRALGILAPEVPRRVRSHIGDMDMAAMRAMLRKESVLSVLCINASKLRKLATRFGSDAFDHVVTEFRKTLLSMWGEPGSFRAEDALCQRKDDSLIFYVILQSARGRDPVPAPGALERLGERVTSRLLGRLWRGVGDPGSSLPSFLTLIPEIGTGYATCVYNPAVDSHDQIAQLVESALDLSRSQIARVRERQRELIMTLIKSDELIAPSYQAVFQLQGMNLDIMGKKNVSSSTQSGLTLYRDLIVGFESLIRVRQATFDQKIFTDLVGYFDSKILKPDVLFALAHENHLALELDQACLSRAIRGSKGLPGALMVNILPRNLYQVEAIKELTGGRKGIVFEVSESEDIGNYAKLSEVCDALRGMEIEIAADDFGKGFGGMDRIVKMRPDIVKFDRSLIDGIDRDPARQTFLTSLIAAARMVGAKVLAEGVERVEEARLCQNLGIDFVQGYLLHRPRFPEEILQELDVSIKQMDGGQVEEHGRRKIGGAA
ncbi:EAL domain-containing protein [bacterium]|nr:EAL domain-containing protein [bacterium]